MFEENLDELDNYMQLPSTIPVEILSFINKKRDEERFFQFLIGLNDTIYGTVRPNIIQQELMPKVKTILAQICKKEQHKHLARSMVTNDRGGTGKPLHQPSSKLMCNHCNKAGHEMTDCF